MIFISLVFNNLRYFNLYLIYLKLHFNHLRRSTDQWAMIYTHQISNLNPSNQISKYSRPWIHFFSLINCLGLMNCGSISSDSIKICPVLGMVNQIWSRILKTGQPTKKKKGGHGTWWKKTLWISYSSHWILVSGSWWEMKSMFEGYTKN